MCILSDRGADTFSWSQSKGKCFLPKLTKESQASTVKPVSVSSIIPKPQSKNIPLKGLKVQKPFPVVLGLVFPVDYTSQKAPVKHPVASAYTVVPLLVEAPGFAVSPPALVAGQAVPAAASSAPHPTRETMM